VENQIIETQKKRAALISDRKLQHGKNGGMETLNTCPGFWTDILRRSKVEVESSN
jgi:hypothetical protein